MTSPKSHRVLHIGRPVRIRCFGGPGCARTLHPQLRTEMSDAGSKVVCPYQNNLPLQSLTARSKNVERRQAAIIISGTLWRLAIFIGFNVSVILNSLVCAKYRRQRNRRRDQDMMPEC